MQQESELQVPLNQGQNNDSQQGAYPSLPQGGYPQGSGYPQINQGGAYPSMNPYSGYQPNYQGAQSGYPQVYNAQTYQQPYVIQTQVQGLAPEQAQALTAQNAARSIESRIISNFCCYTCLIYFELISALGSLIYGIYIYSYLDIGGFIVINVIAGVSMFIACVLAITAKNTFNRRKQRAAFIMFIIATIFIITGFVINIVNLENYNLDYDWCNNYPYNYDYDNSDCDFDYIANATIQAMIISVIVSMAFQLLICFALICCAFSLSRLMRQRDEYLAEAKFKNNAVGAVITV